MKFNSKKSIALSFCFAIIGVSFTMPVMAEVIDENGKLAEKNSEVSLSNEMPESATSSPSRILKESLVSNEDQYPKERLEDTKNSVSSVSDNYKNLRVIGEIDDSPSIIQREAPVSSPVETITISSNNNNQISTIASMPKLGKASQIAQVSIAQSIAQNDETFGLRATRGGPSYLGVGGNFGSRADFAIISKIGLSNSFSLRPSVLLLSNFVTVLIPFTYDFAPQSFLIPDLVLAPYLGGGIAFKTSSDSTIGGLITAGVDIPISRTFTVNVAANLTFLNQTELGILLGIAYNF